MKNRASIKQIVITLPPGVFDVLKHAMMFGRNEDFFFTDEDRYISASGYVEVDGYETSHAFFIDDHAFVPQDFKTRTAGDK